MNREPLRPDQSGDEGSWESLAENLFGIEFRKIPEPGEIVSPEDLDLDELEEPIAAAVPEVVEVSPDEVTELDISAIDESEIDESVEDAALEASDDAVEEGATPAPRDTYWDALKNWSWSEGEERDVESESTGQRGGPPRRGGGGGGGRSGGPRRDDRGSRGGDRGRRSDGPRERSSSGGSEGSGRTEEKRPSSRELPSASTLRFEETDEGDFGAGLLGDDISNDSPKETTPRVEPEARQTPEPRRPSRRRPRTPPRETG